MRPNTSTVTTAFANVPTKARVAAYDWQALAQELDGFGCAVLPKLLSPVECCAISGLYLEEEHFRSHVHMARYGFGKGEYRCFKYPLPDLLGGLRTALYPSLVIIANEWNDRMGIDERYPVEHASFLTQCHDAGQVRPTPLLLQYVPGDFNCLHQNLYGDLFFPIQVAILLSEPGVDFTGGEFVLTEQRPRMQSRAEVVPLRQGDAVAFAVHNRPVRGTKGNYRVNLRHGVSRLRSGIRHTVGIIFSRREIAKLGRRAVAPLQIQPSVNPTAGAPHDSCAGRQFSFRTVNVMKLVRMADGKIGLFVLLPKGAYAIDIASSLGVFSHDPLSNGLLNGVLKNGHHWSLLVNHWAHLRSPLKRLQTIALRSPDHPSLVLQPLTSGPPAASVADPIIAIEITDIDTFEEQDPTGRRAMERQFMPPPESNSPRGSTATETAQVIDFSSIGGDSCRR